jgi:hypothetical protein
MPELEARPDYPDDPDDLEPADVIEDIFRLLASHGKIYACEALMRQFGLNSIRDGRGYITRKDFARKIMQDGGVTIWSHNGPISVRLMDKNNPELIWTESESVPPEERLNVVRRVTRQRTDRVEARKSREAKAWFWNHGRGGGNRGGGQNEGFGGGGGIRLF